MPFDDALAERVRAELAGEPGLTERKMFGGIAWMVGGNLAVGVRGDDLMVRVGPDGAAAALAEPYARQSYMGEREMRGWILVGPVDDLAGWVRRGVEYARSLPAKG
jgi:TfoX/Sxy family transcriptional regulator of competence genes